MKIEIDNIRELVKRFGAKRAIEIAKILFSDNEVLSEVVDVIAAVVGNRRKPDSVFLPMNDGVKLPTYKTTSAAAADIYAPRRTVIPMNEVRTIPTGVRMSGSQPGPAIIMCRSSLAATGLQILGGLIDEDYTGEIHVIIRGGQQATIFEEGDRIAQIMFIGPTVQPDGVDNDSVRRVGGLGSTGR